MTSRFLLTLTLSSLLAAPAWAGTTREENVDRSGRDYRRFNPPAANPDLCRRACEEEDRCRAYTYVRPGVQGPQAVCYLKDRLPVAELDKPCCVSGRKTVATATARLTTFRPEQHGFRFANTFDNNPVLDVRTSGLCGGMAYTALDHFNARVPMPTLTYEPSTGSRLRDYIYRRQVKSLTENLDKWGELKINPHGARNDEFWRWGLEGGRGGRITELRRMIDSGRPVPLGLQGCDEGCTGDHQVLAVGYDMGRYDGNLGPHQEDFRIYVYDPNYPGDRLTLVADLRDHKWRYFERPVNKDGVERNWRTYFVDMKYRPERPPRFPPDAGRELIVKFLTGGDDLRGGRDNVGVRLVLRSGRALDYPNVNGGRRWLDNTENSASLPLPAGVTVADIRARCDSSPTSGEAPGATTGTCSG